MLKYTLILIAVFWVSISISQDSGLPGEDFDLEALPGVIETVTTFEELEKAINTEDNEINNLDLDKNGEVDYMTIDMEKDGDAYIAFLRVAVSESEVINIATIEMEKQSSETASFQIVGDEALYGKDYILEPEGGLVDISEVSSGIQGGKGSPSVSYVPLPPAVRVTICVGVYRPGYRVWVSPYGFRVYPTWYHPWRPVARHHYQHQVVRWHRAQYHRAAHYRSTRTRNMHQKHYHSNKAAHYNTSNNKNTAPSSKNNYNNAPSMTKQSSQPTRTGNPKKSSTGRPVKR